MLSQIRGLHHVTSLASSATGNNAFFTGALGLRRVKKTVNFDAPHLYHLYYGDEVGSPGTVMTYFPKPEGTPFRPGTGEVGTTAFVIPKGTADAWGERLDTLGVKDVKKESLFGETRLVFPGPDRETFALVEGDDERMPWSGTGISPDMAVRGFHSVSMRLQDEGATAELMKYMGYKEVERAGNIVRLAVPGGNEANIVDIETLPGVDPADQGQGSVHHVAFAVENRARQLEVREALIDTGYRVTPVIDRNYFWAIYFRAPGGVLFEVATNEPGFAVDEDTAHLGEALKLPAQHAHLRQKLENTLEPLP